MRPKFWNAPAARHHEKLIRLDFLTGFGLPIHKIAGATCLAKDPKSTKVDVLRENRRIFFAKNVFAKGIRHIKAEIHKKFREPYLYLFPIVTSPIRSFRTKYGYWHRSTYFHTVSDGFFWNFSSLFREVARLHPRAKKIDLSNSFTLFKDQAGSDCWLEYFQTISTPRDPMRFRQFARRTHHHADYRTLDFVEAKRGLDYYFRPSDRVTAQMAEFVKTYAVDFEKIICVCYRGTDKYTEIFPIDPSEYVRAVKSLMDQHPDFRVFVQTDQRQVREMMMAEFGERAFFLAEIPVTSGQVAMHNTLSTDRLDFGVKLFAAVLMMSRCKYLITHTGNVAYWTVLYRGNLNGVHQFMGGQVINLV